MESLEKYRVRVGVDGEEFTDGCVKFLWWKMWVGDNAADGITGCS